MSIKTDDFAPPPSPREASRMVSAAPVSNSEEAIERALRNALDVGRRMHQRQFPVAGSRRLEKADRRQLGRQAIAQAAVLAHGKAVPFGQGQYEMVGVIGVHGCEGEF